MSILEDSLIVCRFSNQGVMLYQPSWFWQMSPVGLVDPTTHFTQLLQSICCLGNILILLAFLFLQITTSGSFSEGKTTSSLFHSWPGVDILLEGKGGWYLWKFFVNFCLWTQRQRQYEDSPLGGALPSGHHQHPNYVWSWACVKWTCIK